MPGPFYDLSSRLKLRMLKGTSEAKDIDTGFHALGEDIEKYLLAAEASSGSHTLTSGEVAIANNTQELKLPSVTTSTICGAICAAGITTILAEGGPKIFGDFLAEAGVTEIKLAKGQHVILLADGTHWYSIAGLLPVTQEAGTTQSFLSWGRVNGTTVEAGSADFTVANPSTGVYEVKWNTEKSTATYVVVATAAEGEFVTVYAVKETTKKLFKLEQLTAKGEKTSGKFSFSVFAAS